MTLQKFQKNLIMLFPNICNNFICQKIFLFIYNMTKKRSICDKIKRKEIARSIRLLKQLINDSKKKYQYTKELVRMSQLCIL